MIGRFPHNPTAYDDDWEDQPAQSFFHKWGLGVVLPLIVAGFGFFAVLMRHAVVEDNARLELHGLNAVALGVAVMSAAFFLHCHYFWGNIYDQTWFAVAREDHRGLRSHRGFGHLDRSRWGLRHHLIQCQPESPFYIRAFIVVSVEEQAYAFRVM